MEVKWESHSIPKELMVKMGLRASPGQLQMSFFLSFSDLEMRTSEREWHREKKDDIESREVKNEQEKGKKDKKKSRRKLL